MYTVTRVWFGPFGWSVTRPAFSNPSRARQPICGLASQFSLTASHSWRPTTSVTQWLSARRDSNFLHGAHELWKVVEVGEQRKHPLDRRTNDHRRLTLGHLLSSVDTRCTPTCQIRNLRGRG
jgi:hypothetical protein